MRADAADRRDPGRLRSRRGGAPGTCGSARRRSRPTPPRCPPQSPPAPDLAPGEPDERRAAFQITLNAINFGSGWFPTLRKQPGMSGFRTVEAGPARPRAVDARRSWPRIGRDEVAAALGQDPEHELMGLFETALRELGARVRDGHGGSFLALARSAGRPRGSRPSWRRWPTWSDVSPYEELRVPFFKRAQIAAADLALAGLAPGDDLHRLTLFADNLVPHVLRLDGVLEFDDDLVARIDAEELIEHDSPEEVEIRACALHAVELLVAAHPEPTTATAVDNHLWHRGAGPRYKARPRHRARTTAY